MELLRMHYGSDLDGEEEEEDEEENRAEILERNQNGKNHPKHENEAPPSTPLPLPQEILDLYGDKEHLFSHDINSDTQRIRSVPHIEGNFATHIYIPVFIPNQKKQKLLQILHECISQMSQLQPMDQASSELPTIQSDIPPKVNDRPMSVASIKTLPNLDAEFHVSLSRTVYLRFNQIQPFIELLQTKFKKIQNRFEIDFGKWQEFVNDECTRSFVSLEITDKGKKEIIEMIDVVNDVFKIYNLPTFYKDPRPHISLLWCLGDECQNLSKLIPRLNLIWADTQHDPRPTLPNEAKKRRFGPVATSVHKAVCRVGQRLHNVWAAS